jgi:hypothetical protein
MIDRACAIVDPTPGVDPLLPPVVHDQHFEFRTPMP